ncbi:hypothetical protein BMS3Abin03_01922 [bacterium BMS3Abin03]|nr:hypothetical protein BMS3Abin03_01922 [bacterium BMS3Abin03]
MNFLGSASMLFGWFFWIIIFAVIIWFVFKLLKRLKNNDLHGSFDDDSAENSEKEYQEK